MAPFRNDDEMLARARAELAAAQRASARLVMWRRIAHASTAAFAVVVGLASTRFVHHASIPEALVIAGIPPAVVSLVIGSWLVHRACDDGGVSMPYERKDIRREGVPLALFFLVLAAIQGVWVFAASRR